ncbi:MAG: DEAD/DEAH box helicase [Rhodanobacter sp.]|nr:MAG: DEAD/DEAH box helicase [Rhodanobacter sp.]TAM09919.1 MAG: DEAD/DEAH box helicase [Rhodanobacter sp.]TAM34263.1 MAG: DEAD/DEAH box helicase [Rhodanobacter sp.]
MNALPEYPPGTLLHARGRDWIVAPGSVAPLLRLRPLAGSDEDTCLIHTGLEPNIASTQFPPLDPAHEGSQHDALLLTDALRMALRRGAGPFRSFGNIAVEPRTYQLVPLLMALRQDPVRLLLADDVGIGKTIEAALIVRELYDRGEISRFAVLCPPHLVEQWITELAARFHLHAEAVTASSVARLERGLPQGESLFEAFPFTVVSLDYIKSERHRSDFLRACPELVVVDEAHTCVSAGRERQQRFALLRDVAAGAERHLLLLTATPHSGDQDSFLSLLALLKPEFAELATAQGARKDALREALAAHFVQRRRIDIDEWHDNRIFPRRETSELTYTLDGPWEVFFRNVLEYCREVTARGGDALHQRLNFWGTLALMRCVASSPAAAVQALRTRLAHTTESEAETVETNLFDGSEDELATDDVAPAADSGDPALQALLHQAEHLAGANGDPKLRMLEGHLSALIADGFNPIVFCRFIATAHYLAAQLEGRYPGVSVACVTGEYPAEERERRVAEAAQAGRRLLVATDCLSEGVNLQDGFDAVVHYDLSWNPTRHEQREGRVDRFGQSSPVTRATLMYGANNPVDGAVLEVILRKAERIRKELGVPVPIPDDDHALTKALMQAVMLRGESRQYALDFDTLPEAQALDVCWVDAAEKAKKNRTIFAQRRLKPDDVLPEWQAMQAVLGNGADVARFVERAMARLGAAPAPRTGDAMRLPVTALPASLRERLEGEGVDADFTAGFSQPVPRGARFVHRSHPLVSTLADELLERALTGEVGDGRELATLGRIGVWRSPAVTQLTSVVLLRLRHQISAHRGGRDSVLLVEQAVPVLWCGRDANAVVPGDDWLALLQAPAAGNLPDAVRQREMANLLAALADRADGFAQLATEQANRLLADHRRVRAAADARGRYEVRALQPVDVVAAFVLLPEVA